ncbi:MAG: class I SAM-dependent methyltransferase [Cyanobacteria bacterium SID2]|nr:class I SAM-dependent methyltransferase [Cyanobacteria bacterium SID2]MBP0003132.1 class I SAM-dependent methyltransferase [Cyanobacteria bacterium SBC]
MATDRKTLWEQFLSPIVRSIVDEEAMLRLSRRIDWETEVQRRRNESIVYPDYYRTSNFHGIEGGYLTAGAAVSYDPITQYVLPPNEMWVRAGLIEAVRSKPRRILDLGCGTGSTTRLLKQAFSEATVIGLDLSPYMLVMANYQAVLAGSDIVWKHGNAEETGFDDESFDLISLSLLLHETPPDVSQRILNECFRLLKSGGEAIVLDGNQAALRQTPWLTNVFEEPYIQAYAEGSVGQWMQKVGFEAVETREHWWLHQVTRGVKPLVVRDFETSISGEGLAFA